MTTEKESKMLHAQEQGDETTLEQGTPGSAKEEKSQQKETQAPPFSTPKEQKIIEKEQKKREKERRKQEKRLQPKKSKKIWIFGALVLIATAGFFAIKSGKLPLGPGNQANQGISVQSVTLSKGDVTEKVILKGPIDSTDRAEVRSVLSGKIVKTTVKLGDKVSKNQLLASVDDSAVRDQIAAASNQAQLSALNLEDTLKKTQESYEDAKRNFREAEKKLNATKELYASGAVAKTELDAAQSAYDALASQIRSYNASEDGHVQATEAQRKSISVQRDEAVRLQKKLADANMLSPISGTITRMEAKEGQATNGLADQSPLFVIENMDKLEMKIKVSEYDIGKIKLGQKVKITADILRGDSVSGSVSSIALSGERKDASSAEMVIPVTISMDDKKTLIPGITARAEIIVAQAKDVLVAPLDAVLYDTATDQNSLLVIEEDDTLKQVHVTLGVQSSLNAQIIAEGLYDGAQIVAQPDSTMKTGTKVMVAP